MDDIGTRLVFIAARQCYIAEASVVSYSLLAIETLQIRRLAVTSAGKRSSRPLLAGRDTKMFAVKLTLGSQIHFRNESILVWWERLQIECHSLQNLFSG